MTVKDPEIIKQIICSNFDKSVQSYESYERKYGLFRHLTNELAKACDIQEGMTVCDIGCGTGASTLALAELVGEGGRVIGIDFSDEMLKVAKAKMGNLTNIDFKSCDAEKLDEKIDFKVDAILYNASIFLIPNPSQTLRAAYDVLDHGGIVGMNYLKGIFSEKGDINLFSSAKEERLEFAPYGREVVDIRTLPNILSQTGFKDIEGGVTPLEMTKDKVKEFYCIPAQSAGLYPKTPYEERLKMLDALFDYIQDTGHTTLYQIWGWNKGKK